MRGLDAGGKAEFFGADMHRAADPDRAEAEIDPGFALASVMKSCTVFHGRVIGTIITLALEPIISTDDKILGGVEVEIGKDRRRDGQRRRVRQDGVAVGVGLRDR